MHRTLPPTIRSAVLVCAIALVASEPVHAQMTGGPGLSSGSGQGTGAGGRTGVLRNPTGSLSGVGPPSARFGPGVDESFPTDRELLPYLTIEHYGQPSDPNAPSLVTPELVKQARAIQTPEERSLSLERIANGAIASNQLTLAHNTLEEAMKATSEVTIPLVRDQRLIEIVKSLSALSSALLLVGREALDTAAPLLPEQPAPDNSGGRQIGREAAPPKGAGNAAQEDEFAKALRSSDFKQASAIVHKMEEDLQDTLKRDKDKLSKTQQEALRDQLFQMSRQLTEREFAHELGRGDFKKSSDLIQTLKDEFQYGQTRPTDKLSDSQARAMREQLSRLARQLNDTVIRIARLEWRRGVYLASIIGNPTYRNEMLYKVADSEASGSASIAAIYLKTAADSAGDVQPLGNTPGNDRLATTADSILVDAFEVAKKIDRLIWKYRAMIQVAIAAADSQQYTRGVELCRGIDNGESRAEAMMVLAESQCRNNQNQAATAAYQEAARAVGMIQQEGLRGVLAGFVIESMIVTGRFEDARACVVLFPMQSQRLVALGLIAESQGRRGAAESARRWIAREIPEQYRDGLYRHVVVGVLQAIDEKRNQDENRNEELMNDLNRPSATPPPPVPIR
jgi:hypothetical protein